MKRQGFDVVPCRLVDAAGLAEAVASFTGKIENGDIPADGLVLTFDDIAYGQSLGRTAKFPRDAIAFKWQDEIRETKLVEIEWSASRTGLINPIAVFEPVELEGTTVRRASVHNISILEGLQLGIGDTIGVYKANMIIPQIAENMTRSGTAEIPRQCPVCGGETAVRQENGVKTLYCTNESCMAKQIKAFTHFVSRDAINIEGLSEATIEKFIAKGFIREYADFFRLDRHKDEIVQMEGFGEKSYQKLAEAVNKARRTNAVRLLYSLGIPNIGLANAKLICRKMDYDWNKIVHAEWDQLIQISGIGEVMVQEFVRFFSNEETREILDHLLAELELSAPEASSAAPLLEDVQFVITGSVEHFKNRNDLKETIEKLGGKVTDSVTTKTNYLINNDKMSGSSKNKKAKELGIPILSEAQLLEWLNDGIRPQADESG